MNQRNGLIEVTLYVDVFPGMDLRYAFGYANPPALPSGSKRYAVQFSILDPNGPAEVVQGRVKEVKE